MPTESGKVQVRKFNRTVALVMGIPQLIFGILIAIDIIFHITGEHCAQYAALCAVCLTDGVLLVGAGIVNKWNGLD